MKFVRFGFLALWVGLGANLLAAKPNVILIICDDMNDYVEGFVGHPQAKTPNMTRIARSGVTFT